METAQLQTGKFFQGGARPIEIAIFCNNRKNFLYQSFLTASFHINKYHSKCLNSTPYQHQQRQESLFMTPSPP
jgi:hypothetical protein